MKDHSEFQPSIDASQFVEPGSDTQCDVWIGLDFGTSSTRVVLRTPYVYRNRVFAVSFGNLGHPGNHFLLPTKVYRDGGGRLSLDPSRGSELGNLKMSFLDAPRAYAADESGTELCLRVEELATAYLALVLRYVRRWFLHHERSAYGNFPLRWHLNVGIPSAGYDDDDLRELHERLARAAWWLSAQECEINEDLASQAVQRLTENRASSSAADVADLESIRVIPEVAAEVATYARSDQRRGDLHVLIDVGASTMDVCGFVLHERDGEDKYELLTAEVQKLGVVRLHFHRMGVVRRCFEKWIDQELLPSDPIVPLLQPNDSYMPDRDGLKAMDDNFLDADFSRDSVALVMRCLMGLKKDRYPTFAYVDEKVPVFFCGGGSRAEFFAKVYGEAHRRFRDAGHRGLTQLRLPTADLVNHDADHEIDEERFQFLGVAYGLSYPEYDIGTIRPPSDIPSVPPEPIADWRRYYVGKDQV